MSSGVSSGVLAGALHRVASGASLDEAEAEAAFAAVMDGLATPVQLGALLMALRVRGETEAELAGAARAMRARMRRVRAPDDTVDVCGTGGDGRGTLNVSTAVGFVLAACGVKVAKHGNRAVSSRAGATDTLAALGIGAEDDPAALEAAIAGRGIVFLAAPAHHPAMRHAAPVRAELGVRTLFNLLGPVCNPAGVRRQMIGVFDPRWAVTLARVLRRLGSDGAWVVHGSGMDELALHGSNRVVVLEGGRIGAFGFDAGAAGLPARPEDAIAGGGAAENALALRRMLGGETGAYRDTVLLNAGAALCMAAGAGISGPMFGRDTGAGPDAIEELVPPLAAIRDGIGRAARAIDDGSALAVLHAARGTAFR